MKHFLTVLGHETRMLLVNPSTYIAAVLFLIIMGVFFTGILDLYSEAPQETSPAATFFRLFWVPVLFIVPLLTMKSISEERRHGTLETLLTTPVSTGEVVLGKYGAAYLLYLLLWGSTGGFFYLLNRFAGDARFLDAGPLIGGYIYAAVSGLLFVAVGILASALSRNQAVAGILAFTMLFGLIFGASYLSNVEFFKTGVLAPARLVVDYAHVFTHLDDFSRGVVDTRQVLFYFSGTAIALIFSILGVEAKLLHS